MRLGDQGNGIYIQVDRRPPVADTLRLTGQRIVVFQRPCLLPLPPGPVRQPLRTFCVHVKIGGERLDHQVSIIIYLVITEQFRQLTTPGRSVALSPITMKTGQKHLSYPLSNAELIKLLALQRHPEGGEY